MFKRHFVLACSLAFAPFALSAEPNEPLNFQVDLQDPIFQNGVISTDKGGIITAEGIRIQARKIEYTNRIENGVTVRKILAEGDLLLEYGEQAFVGSLLEYDLISHTGLIKDGKTFADLWFIGGEKIFLQSDGSYYIVNAFITSWASDDPLWEAYAGKIHITKDRMLAARNLRFKFAKIPFFWMPSFRANLKFVKKPPIRFKIIDWNKKLGPKISARWRIYSWETLDVFVRGDYRIAEGGGAALETDYKSENSLTECLTRTYGSYNDPSTPIINAFSEYRVQGTFRTQSYDDKTHMRFSYDWISSEKMISEFKSDDFEIDSRLRTRFILDHEASHGFVNLQVQPRINHWQSINQELPSLSLGLRPYSFGSSGLIMYNWTNASYLDYVYASNLKDYLHDTHAARVQTTNSLSYPLRLGYVTLTPDIGIIAIFYNNNPFHRSIGQFMGTYGATLQTRLCRNYTYLDHVFEPYATFRGLTKPRSTEQITIFSLEDGYHRINTLRFGFVNSFYPRTSIDPPRFSTDIYTYAFFANRGQLSPIPRLYTDLALEYPTCHTNVGFVWNMQKGVIDRINTRLSWTIIDDFAFIFEYRHRSRFDWRKADHDNYILDQTRSFHELLQSPLSDGRNTILFSGELKLHPLWTLHGSSHFGWGRSSEPVYHSGKVDLSTTLITGWKIRLTATITADDVRFTSGMEMIKY